MKKIKFILFLSFTLLISCSEDDQEILQGRLNPVAINFTYADGSLIPLGQCLSDQEQYAIEIETETPPNTIVETANVGFTFNGSLYSLTFSEAGKLRVPVSLIDGDNTCQLLESGITSQVRFVKQNEFSAVE